MKQENPKSAISITGIIFIIIGALFLLNNFDFIPYDISHYIFSWKTLLIGIGALMLIQNKERTTAFVLIGIGTLFMLPMIFDTIYLSMRYMWPLFIIGVGVIIIFKGKDESYKSSISFNSSKQHNENYFESVSIFSGNKQNITTQRLKGGKILSIFGGSEILLKNCDLDDNFATIELFVVFGGTKIIVPDTWDVRIETTPIFGAFEDKRHSFPTHFEGERKTLIIRGVVIFGGGEIKSY